MSVRSQFLFSCSLLVPSGLVYREQCAELHTLKGEMLKGELESITDKEIVVKEGGKSSVTPLADVLKLDFPAVNSDKLEGSIVISS